MAANAAHSGSEAAEINDSDIRSSFPTGWLGSAESLIVSLGPDDF